MAPERPSDYQWTPLTNPNCSTRLFTLLPGAPASPIQCKLFEVDLPIQQPYTALSYEWGPRTTGNAVCIDEGIFHIQRNLNTFLLQLRSRLASDQALTLWVDAICIDQMSTQEKNHQVRMMGKIFSQAKEVIAWLGESSDRISRLFDRVEGSSLRHELETQSNNTADSIYHTAARNNRCSLQSLQEVCWYDTYKDFHSDLSDLAAASYWRRGWIVQEVVLAREVSLLCGTAHISDTGVATLCCIICRYLATQQPDTKTMNQMNRLCMVFLNRMRFLDPGAVDERHDWMALDHLIRHHSLSETHDPRDKVYAFVGMAQDLEQDFIVDYNKSFRQITVEIIRGHTPSYERAIDSYFSIIVALLASELQQQQSLTHQVEWTEEFSRSCRQTLPPGLLDGQLHLRLWLIGRVSSVTGLRVLIEDIAECVGINVTARDYATACSHVSGESAEPRDIVFRLRGTQLCCVYRLTKTEFRFVAIMIVIAHPGGEDSHAPAAGDWKRAQVLYKRSQLCDSFRDTTKVPDTGSVLTRYRTLITLRQWIMSDDTFYTRSSGIIHFTASISVTDFLVLVEADFGEYLQHYHNNLTWHSDPLMLNSKIALTEAAFKLIDSVSSGWSHGVLH